MKLGILTFVHTGDIGALCQAYAMQHLFTQAGADCELVDYCCPAIQSAHDPKMLWRRKGIKAKLAAPLQYFVYQKRLRQFRSFEKRYMRFSRMQYTRSTISGCQEIYDGIVTGSDQVWNPELTDGDMTFFLDFVTDAPKKHSYAASIGISDFSEEYKNTCLDLIRQFAVVNVREQSAQKLLAKEKITAGRVLDPTLMLEKEHWMRFVGERPIKEPYIFTYLIPEKDGTPEAVVSFAEKEGYRVYGARKGVRPLKGTRVLNTLSPEAFLTWLYHADMTVVGSFHGLCFSILFQKKFLVTSSLSAKRNSRLEDLLLALGLGECWYNSCVEFVQPDYCEVNCQLDALRQESRGRIVQILETLEKKNQISHTRSENPCC